MTTIVDNIAATIVMVSFLSLGNDLTQLIASKVDSDSRLAFALTCTTTRDAIIEFLGEDGKLTTVVPTIFEKMMSFIEWGYICNGFLGCFETRMFQLAVKNNALYELLELLDKKGCFFGEDLVAFMINKYYDSSQKLEEILKCLYNFNYAFGKNTINAVLKNENAITLLQWLFSLDDCEYDDEVFYEALKIFGYNNYGQSLTDYSDDSSGSCFKLIIDTYGIPYDLNIEKIESIACRHYNDMYVCDCDGYCECDRDRIFDDKKKAVKNTVDFFTEMWNNHYKYD